MKILIIFLIIVILFLSLFATRKLLLTMRFLQINGILSTFNKSQEFYIGWSPEEDLLILIAIPFFFKTLSKSTPNLPHYQFPLWKKVLQHSNGVFLNLPAILQFIFSWFLQYFSLSIFLSYKKIFSNNYLFAILAFICSPLFVGMSGNIIRTGLALWVLIIIGSISYLFNKKNKRSGVGLLISIYIPYDYDSIHYILLILFNIKKYKFNVFILASIISALYILDSNTKLLFSLSLSQFRKNKQILLR